MKILFVASIEQHILSFHLPFINQLISEGHRVDAAVCMNANRDEVREGISWRHIEFSRSPLGLSNIGAFIALINLLKKEKYDLIHVHTPVASFLGRLAAVLTQTRPVLYTVHGFHFYTGAPLLNWVVYYTAEMISRRWTDAIIVINKADFFQAQQLGYVAGRTVFPVAGVGVELTRFSCSSDSTTLRKEWGLDENAVVVVWIGEYTENKNHPFLFAGWKIVEEKFTNAYLILVGDGPRRNKLSTLAAQMGLKRVRFLGFRTDIPNIINAADIGTLVSMREGLPRSIMEFMAAGKPVVATQIRGNVDLVNDGSTGFLVAPGDIQRLAGRFICLISDRILRERMGQEARKAIPAFSVTNVNAQLHRIYRRFLRKKHVAQDI